MKTPMHSRALAIWAALLVLGMATTTHAFEQMLDDVQSDQLIAAIKSYHAGDYQPALDLFHPLAEDGVAEAQFFMGFLHGQALGLPQDYEVAAQWYGLAARQGHPQAQNYLGLLYYEGRGVLKSFRDAFIYFELAAAAENADAANNRLIVARKMTSAQITEAQKAAAEIIIELQTNVPDVAAPRRTSTGVVINSAGDILTHASAVVNCTKISVLPAAGEGPETPEAQPAEAMLIDEFNSLAIIRAPGIGEPVPLRGSELAVGEAVIIQGYGLNSDKELVLGAVSATVSEDPALYRVDTRFVQLDSLVAPTYLGAPVFDDSGRLAAIMVPGTQPETVASLLAAPGRIGFALRQRVAALLLDLNGYAYDVESADQPPAADVDLRMRRATVAIECWREEEPSPPEPE